MREEKPAALGRKGWSPPSSADANARLGEGSQFPCAEAVGQIRQLGSISGIGWLTATADRIGESEYRAAPVVYATGGELCPKRFVYRQ
jgi:hypothetical protein